MKLEEINKIKADLIKVGENIKNHIKHLNALQPGLIAKMIRESKKKKRRRKIKNRRIRRKNI